MKIEEGMYVRTRNGIAKILGKVNDPCNYYYKMLITDKFLKIHDDTEYINDLDVIKASYNIIDLIEEGDYVNGYPVVDFDVTYFNGIDRREEPKRIGVIVEKKVGFSKTYFKNEDIKTILTKEQYENNCYKVDDK